MFFCKNNLQFLVHWWALRWWDIQISTEVFPPTVYNSWTHYVQLAFFLLANKHPTSYEDVSVIRYQRLQNLMWMFLQQLFMLPSKPPFRTQWQLWPGLEVKACRFHLGQLVAKNAMFGTLQIVWKERLSGQFLKKIFGLSLSHRRKSATVLLWNFYPIFRTTSKWNSFATTC